MSTPWGGEKERGKFGRGEKVRRLSSISEKKAALFLPREKKEKNHVA